MSAQYRVGDQVELVRPLPFRRELRAGVRGEIVAVGWSLSLVSVLFTGKQYPHQVAPRHLALVSPAPAEATG
jgi:hypothetical protein